jgi:hypothetical protein
MPTTVWERHALTFVLFFPPTVGKRDTSRCNYQSFSVITALIKRLGLSVRRQNERQAMTRVVVTVSAWFFVCAISDAFIKYTSCGKAN